VRRAREKLRKLDDKVDEKITKRGRKLVASFDLTTRNGAVGNYNFVGRA
jgi:hypothetical protein